MTSCKQKQSDASTVDAAPPPEPAVEFVGRCINETSGAPYQSLFFFPKKGEMMAYLGTGAMRVPVSVTQQAPRKVEFTFRWAEGDQPAETRAGSVTAEGKKWRFELEGLKGSTCHPVPTPDYFKILPELGIQAGKWQDPKVKFGVVVAADAQAWLLTQKGVTTLIHYRVLEHDDNGLLLASYGNTPGDAEAEAWAITRMVKNGETLVHELKDLKLNYKLVSAAPTVK